MDAELATAESQHPVLLLEDGDGEEEEDGLGWSRHWATAKPAREEGSRIHTTYAGAFMIEGDTAGGRGGQRWGETGQAIQEGPCWASATSEDSDL